MPTKLFKLGHIPWNKGKKMFNKYGVNHHNWKGGRRIDANGYVILQINGKTIYEHRFEMEKYLKRKLRRREIVHHKNGIKTDNRIKNLDLISQSLHMRIHHLGISKRTEKRNCLNCNKKFITFLSDNKVFCSHKCFWIKRKGNSRYLTFKRKA